jgi:hypothetical protein
MTDPMDPTSTIPVLTVPTAASGGTYWAAIDTLGTPTADTPNIYYELYGYTETPNRDCQVPDSDKNNTNSIVRVDYADADWAKCFDANATNVHTFCGNDSGTGK